MKKLFAIIEKDVRQLVHSKSSALIILISPIVLMILAGLALSSSGLSGVKVGMFLGAEKSMLGEDNIGSILDAKMAEKGFTVQYFSNLNQCKQSVKDETTHICIEVAQKDDENLAKIDARMMYRVNFYVDYSKVRLVWAIVNAIRTIVAQENAKITAEMAGKLSQKMDWTFSEVNAKQHDIDELIRQGEAMRSSATNVESKVNTFGEWLNAVQLHTDSLRKYANDIRTASTRIDDEVYELKKIPVIESIPLVTNTRFNSITQATAEMKAVASGIESSASVIDTTIRQMRTKKDEIRDATSGLSGNIGTVLSELRTIKTSINNVAKELEWTKSIKATDIMNPIPVEVLPLSGEVTEVGSVSSALTYLDYLLPALVILVIMFVATLISSTMVIKERKSVAYFRNLIAPTNSALYVIGVYLIGLILVGMQATLLVLVASFFFGVVISSYLSIALVLLLTISIFVLLGVIIGYLFNSEETTMMGAISLALVCLLFSALIIPLETMPVVMRGIAQFSPFVIAETALRKIMIFGIPIINREAGTIMMEPVKLAVIAIVLFVAALVLQRFKNKKEI